MKKLFIEHVLDNKIIIYKQKKDNIIAKLVELGFPKLATDEGKTDSYDYVTEMKLFNLTEEKIAELTEKYNNKEKELRHIEVTTETEQWIVELDEFVNAYKTWEKNNQCLVNENIPKIKAALAKPVNVKPAGFKTIVSTTVSKAKITTTAKITKTTKSKK